SLETAQVWIGELVSGIGNLMKRGLDNAWDGIKSAAAWALQWLIDEVGKTPKRLSAAASGMWDGLKLAFKSALNWVIEKWNS
ncbi:hypothetical protein, partial [Streptococcus pneumoniae]